MHEAGRKDSVAGACQAGACQACARAPEHTDGDAQAPRQALAAPERQQLRYAKMINGHQICEAAAAAFAQHPVCMTHQMACPLCLALSAMYG